MRTRFNIDDHYFKFPFLFISPDDKTETIHMNFPIEEYSYGIDVDKEYNFCIDNDIPLMAILNGYYDLKAINLLAKPMLLRGMLRDLSTFQNLDMMILEQLDPLSISAAGEHVTKYGWFSAEQNMALDSELKEMIMKLFVFPKIYGDHGIFWKIGTMDPFSLATLDPADIQNFAEHNSATYLQIKEENAGVEHYMVDSVMLDELNEYGLSGQGSRVLGNMEGYIIRDMDNMLMEDFMNDYMMDKKILEDFMIYTPCIHTHPIGVFADVMMSEMDTFYMDNFIT